MHSVSEWIFLDSWRLINVLIIVIVIICWDTWGCMHLIFVCYVFKFTFTDIPRQLAPVDYPYPYYNLYDFYNFRSNHRLTADEECLNMVLSFVLQKIVWSLLNFLIITTTKHTTLLIPAVIVAKGKSKEFGQHIPDATIL